MNSWRHKFISLFNWQLKFPWRVTYGKLQRFTIISHPSLNERFTHILFYRWHHVGEFSFESFAFFLERKIFFLDIVQSSASMSYSAPEFLCECFVYEIFSTIFFFSFSVFSNVTQHTYFICAHRIEQVFWINSISLSLVSSSLPRFAVVWHSLYRFKLAKTVKEEWRLLRCSYDLRVSFGMCWRRNWKTFNSND